VSGAILTALLLGWVTMLGIFFHGVELDKMSNSGNGTCIGDKLTADMTAMFFEIH
jgi:hypothetical protein